LDASTKIYAYRVDCVHNDTLKMAGGLGRTEAQGQDSSAPDGETDDASKMKKKSKVCYYAIGFLLLLVIFQNYNQLLGMKVIFDLIDSLIDSLNRF